MNHKALLILLTILSSSLSAIHPDTSTYLTKHLGGTIQFPKGTNPVPEVRVYSSGRIIACTTHKKSASVSFNIPEDKYQHHFFILITEPCNIAPHSKENEPNVIDHLKIDPKKAHKFYQLTLSRDIQSRTFIQVNQQGGKKKRNNAAWTINEIPLTVTNGRIPDETIIICLPPHIIDRLENNHGLALPTIFIKEDFAASSGDIFSECLLAAMDLDTIHGPIDKHMRAAFEQKLVVAMNV